MCRKPKRSGLVGVDTSESKEIVFAFCLLADEENAALTS
jgi:hypothetical protein